MLILKTDQKRLLASMQDVVGVVERRHTLPILSNVLLRKTGSRISLTTSDLDLQISTHADLGGDAGDFATTLAARKLVDILRALPAEQPVSLSAKAGKIVLQGGNSRFTLHTLPAQDFPLVQDAAGVAPPVLLAQPLLRTLLAQVEFAMAVQDIRYYLNGVLLAMDGHTLTLVATDGNRLALAQATVEAELPRTEVILPRKAVQALLAQLRDDAPADNPVEMRFAPAQARFTAGGVELTTKLVEGKYPDYRRVIPAHNPQQVTVQREALLAGLQRAAILTNDRFKAVTLNISPGTLRIHARNAEQEEAMEEVEIAYEGPDIEIGLNVVYLLDLLTHSAADKVTLALRDAQAPVLVTLQGQAGLKYVVSPLRI